MDELSIANKRLKVTRDEHERDYKNIVRSQTQWEGRLRKRMGELIRKKNEAAEVFGNPNATGEDLVEVNAGGKIVVAKRSTLTEIQGTKFRANFQRALG